MLAKRRSRRRRPLRFILITVGLFLFFGGAAYVVWLSDVFSVRAIEVSGATLVDESVISGELGGNILFWKLPVNVSDYPQIESAEVIKDYAERKINIEVKEREKTIIWCQQSSENCFWIDDSGLVFNRAPIPEGSLVVHVVKDQNDRELKIGEKVLADDLFVNLKNAIELLDGVNISVEEIRVDDLKFKEATAVLANGPEVYFSLSIDPRFGRGVLESLMKSPDWSAIRYVDLRVENRAYYSL